MSRALICRRKREVMESLNLIALLFLSGAMLFPTQGFKIEGRNMNNFATVVNCANESVNNLAIYNYGCFCGIGGTGNQPVDAIDRCCYLHDQCYGQAIIMGCSIWTTLYISRCYDAVPTCGGSWLTWFPCVNKLCECDLTAVKCFRKHSDEFNQSFVHYNQDLCQSSPYVNSQ
ncbi:basic phospholipase A2 PA-9C-like [Stegostoma tigrinum]|uniref:basic phospholipase A2 PA-9C-like n=1 Tax=Stegostoma tigrinum TaxID=3053191 RepID=UPI00202AFDB6|nr:basic phospholipase A2 PA-9C-like [Stegostoma tigrinum]